MLMMMDVATHNGLSRISLIPDFASVVTFKSVSVRREECLFRVILPANDSFGHKDLTPHDTKIPFQR